MWTTADRRTLWMLLAGFWILFVAIPQRGPEQSLSGALVEALVERGRLHFESGRMISADRFLNEDTRTESFRVLFNVFPHEDEFRVNHSPGLFLLAAPVYAGATVLGYRFSTHESAVWWIMIGFFSAPLAALGVAALYRILRARSVSARGAMLGALSLGLASPWWPAAGLLYQDIAAAALALAGWALIEPVRAPGAASIGESDPGPEGGSQRVGSQGSRVPWRPLTGGLLLGLAVLTSYLVIPVVVGLLVLTALRWRITTRTLATAAGFAPMAAALAAYQWVTFGSPLATGYSEGGFDRNYPGLDPANMLEKLHFYLVSPEYGLAVLFPVFLVAGLALLWRAGKRGRTSPGGSAAEGGSQVESGANFPGALDVTTARAVLALAALHFAFIVSIPHHGSVGHGIGRFFLPLFPLLAFGVPALWAMEGRGRAWMRGALAATALVSVAHALAGAALGLHGVMEPQLLSLQERLSLQFPAGDSLLWLSAAVLGIGAVVVDRRSHPSAPTAGAASDHERSEPDTHRNTPGAHGSTHDID